jgi:hypothetical protein
MLVAVVNLGMFPDTALPEAVAHVAHAIVPVVVIVPPVIGEVVAMDVTVPPLPAGLVV